MEPAEEEVGAIVMEAGSRVAIREHGGQSSERCLWAGCRERALKGKKLCYKHLY